MNDKQKPSIRFKGFTEAWEQRKLGEVGKCQSGVGFPDSEQGCKIGTPFYKVSDMNIYGNEHEMIYANNYVTDEQIARKNWKPITEVPAVIFAKVGAAIMLNRKRLCRFPFLLDNNTMTYKFNNQWDTNFGKTLFEKTDLTELVQVGALPSYNATDVENLDIKIPNDINEQREIGEFFANIDHLITLHQRKYDKLVNVKKSMLEKMFPRDGKNVPEIRFAGFTEAWEQRKLLDCIEKIIDFRGRTPKKLGMDWSESGYLALSALNVKDGYIDFTQDVHYGNQELYDKWMIGNELHRGQVLFTTEAPMGNVAQVPDNRRYILSQRTIAFNVKGVLITENFLATILRSPNVIATLTALSSGGTAKGVSQKSLSTVEIIIPNDLGEQERLANVFLKLDHLITLHQREVEKLKNIKKSCLEKMFV